MISATPFSEAKRTKVSQCADGIPRTRQTLTVEGCNDKAVDTALVPPNASMTESGVIMEETLVCTVQTCQEFASCQTTFDTGYDGIGGMMIDPPHAIVGRLEALRKELNIPTQEKFANEIGLDKSTYSLMKKGERNLSFETACRIKDKWGISLDWLFYGEFQKSADQIMTRIGRGPAVHAPAPISKPPKRKSA